MPRAYSPDTQDGLPALFPDRFELSAKSSPSLSGDAEAVGRRRYRCIRPERVPRGHDDLTDRKQCVKMGFDENIR